MSLPRVFASPAGNKVNKRGGCAVIKTRTIRFAGKGIGNPADVYIDYVWSCKRELTAYGYAVDRISRKNRIVLFIRQEEAPALKHFGLRHGRQRWERSRAARTAHKLQWNLLHPPRRVCIIEADKCAPETGRWTDEQKTDQTDEYAAPAPAEQASRGRIF